LPILGLLAAPASLQLVAIAVVTLVSLGALGLLGGRLGGASVGRAALRVTFGGALAMAIAAGIGRLLGIAGL
jgi:VIT1/CCC1 family predicted Fe2+/Mn2+ transporter